MASDSDISRFIPLIQSVIDGQKRANASLEAVGVKYDGVQTGIERIGKQIGRLHEAQLTLGSDVIAIGPDIQRITNRLDAISNRLDAFATRMEELEHQTERGLSENRETRSELTSQYNEILNAIQASLTTRIDLEAAIERIDRLERKTGL